MMQLWQTTTENQRKQSISIDSLLNKDSVDPIQHYQNKILSNFYKKNGNFISISKAKRKRILNYQFKRLMEVFKETDTPTSDMRSQLAKELDMTVREVQVWFQNRRAKARNKLNQFILSENKSTITFHRFQHHTLYTTNSFNHLKLIAPKLSSSIRRSHMYIPPNNSIDVLASAAELMK